MGRINLFGLTIQRVYSIASEEGQWTELFSLAGGGGAKLHVLNGHISTAHRLPLCRLSQGMDNSLLRYHLF